MVGLTGPHSHHATTRSDAARRPNTRRSGGRPPEDTTSEPVRAFREHSSPERVGLVEAFAHQTKQIQRLLRLAQNWHNSVSRRRPLPTPAYRTMPRLKPEQAQQVIAGYRAGATVYELAAKFGINRKTVSRALHREQIPMRMVGLNEQQIEEAERLYRGGRSLADIAERLHVDTRTVHRRLRERGLLMRDTQGRDR